MKDFFLPKSIKTLEDTQNPLLVDHFCEFLSNIKYSYTDPEAIVNLPITKPVSSSSFAISQLITNSGVKTISNYGSYSSDGLSILELLLALAFSRFTDDRGYREPRPIFDADNSYESGVDVWVNPTTFTRDILKNSLDAPLEHTMSFAFCCPISSAVRKYRKLNEEVFKQYKSNIDRRVEEDSHCSFELTRLNGILNGFYSDKSSKMLKDHVVLPSVSAEHRMVESYEPEILYQIRDTLAKETGGEFLEVYFTKHFVVFGCPRYYSEYSGIRGSFNFSTLSGLLALSTAMISYITLVEPKKFGYPEDPYAILSEEEMAATNARIKKRINDELKVQNEYNLIYSVNAAIKSMIAAHSTADNPANTRTLIPTPEEEENLINLFRTYLGSLPEFDFSDSAQGLVTREKFHDLYTSLGIDTDDNKSVMLKEFIKSQSESIKRTITEIKEKIVHKLNEIHDLEDRMIRQTRELVLNTDAEKKASKAFNDIEVLIEDSPIIKMHSNVYDDNGNPAIRMVVKQPIQINVEANGTDDWLPYFKSAFNEALGSSVSKNKLRDKIARLLRDCWDETDTHKPIYEFYTTAIIDVQYCSNKINAYKVAIKDIGHPHLMRYNCFGTYQRMVEEALASMDIAGATEIALAAASGLNCYDSPVFKAFCIDIFCKYETSKNIRDIKTGKFYTIKEVFDMYDAQDIAEAKAEAQRKRKEERAAKKAAKEAEIAAAAEAIAAADAAEAIAAADVAEAAEATTATEAGIDIEAELEAEAFVEEVRRARAARTTTTGT